ncbi:putative facilitator of salicylate uptake [Altererythrobacter epoxidivorans]|uniref:Putative facilitator of salicylate uptake n=1 Tax=Altererythrobacter epoxidivorans TaxID=361183 RepID=A0A0M3T9X9_9SPHN|nr:outer membrane protein transport protein [Altererythrobacter epoxidivorans]ALE16092.1 putative facilitator of salicylate uptake [Altererythrobacter epoxidivorans]
MGKLLKAHMKCAAALCALTLGASQAYATEGYFANGVGARHKAVAGAGVADARDATAITINPAGLANLDENEVAVALSLFNPNREFTVTGGPGFLPDGTTESNVDIFPIPNFAIAYKVGENGTLGFSLSGNGGLNTNYSAVDNPACSSGPFPASDGVYCGGKSGVNLMQLFFSAAYAHDFGAVKVGVTPIFAVQRFRARGLAAFGGVSSDPTNLTDNGQSYSTGFGARVGVQVDPAPGFRIGATYQTKFSMGEFDEYAGLFADQGGFDIPSTWQVGIAADVSPQLTVMADYRRINYSDVTSVNNPSSVMLPFGSTDGPGFGWDDVDAYKLGVEYRPDEGSAFRFGYSHNSQPISGDDVTINVLAPGVQKDHFTAGASFAMGDSSTLELALMHSPGESVTGIEVTPMGPNPGRDIEIKMNQWEFTLGMKFKL